MKLNICNLFMAVRYPFWKQYSDLKRRERERKDIQIPNHIDWKCGCHYVLFCKTHGTLHRDIKQMSADQGLTLYHNVWGRMELGYKDFWIQTIHFAGSCLNNKPKLLATNTFGGLGKMIHCLQMMFILQASIPGNKMRPFLLHEYELCGASTL